MNKGHIATQDGFCCPKLKKSKTKRIGNNQTLSDTTTADHGIER